MTALAVRSNLLDLIPSVRDACISPRTKQVYAWALRDFIVWNQGYELERTRVYQYRTHLLETGKSTSTVNLALSAIRKLAGEAEAQGVLGEHVAALIRGVEGVPSRGVRYGNWLTEDQALEMLGLPNLTTASGLRDFVLLSLLLGCGLRREEAAGVTVEQVVRRGDRWVILDVTGKGRKLRTVVIPRWLEDPLTEWTASNTDGKLLRRINRGGRIQREGMGATNIAYIVVRYAAKVGVQCSPHDLRRTFALQSLEGGANVETIRQALGHSNLATTTKYVSSGLNLKNPACDYLLLP